MFAKGRKLGKDIRGRIGDEQVKGVVCVTILIRFTVGLLQDGEERGIAFTLRCECYLQILQSVVF